MSLLNNELVKKYFGCEPICHFNHKDTCMRAMALRVLEAMEDPIKNGELAINYELGVIQNRLFVWPNNQESEGFHPTLMRLPSQFQPSRFPDHTHRGVCECGALVINPNIEKPDPVEDRLFNLVNWKKQGREISEEDLRELVELARKENK